MPDTISASSSAVGAASKRKIQWWREIRGIIGMLLAIFGVHSLVAKPFYIPSESMMPGLLVGDRLVVSKYPYGWSYISASFHILPFMHGRLFSHMPERGDVVIVTPPGQGRRSDDLIKRVIGLPGDRIEMAGGRLRLNGKAIATYDIGYRLIPVDGNFHCDASDADPERAFPGYAGAKSAGTDGKPYCRLHVIRETLPNGRTYETLDFGRSSEDDFPTYTVPDGHVFLMGDNRDNSADSRIPLDQNGLGGAVPIENLGGRAEFVTFSLNGSAGWNPLTWFGDFRGGRSGTSLRAVKDPSAARAKA